MGFRDEITEGIDSLPFLTSSSSQYFVRGAVGGSSMGWGGGEQELGSSRIPRLSVPWQLEQMLCTVFLH